MTNQNGTQRGPLFSLGALVATPGALTALQDSSESAAKFLARHIAGDWGLVDEEDQRANDEAVKNGDRILSAYKTTQGEKLWIITEADRSSTCALLPSEY